MERDATVFAGEATSSDPAVGLAGVASLRGCSSRSSGSRSSARARRAGRGSASPTALAVSKQAVHKKYGHGRRLPQEEPVSFARADARRAASSRRPRWPRRQPTSSCGTGARRSLPPRLYRHRARAPGTARRRRHAGRTGAAAARARRRRRSPRHPAASSARAPSRARRSTPTRSAPSASTSGRSPAHRGELRRRARSTVPQRARGGCGRPAFGVAPGSSRRSTERTGSRGPEEQLTAGASSIGLLDATRLRSPLASSAPRDLLRPPAQRVRRRRLSHWTVRVAVWRSASQPLAGGPARSAR